jgi:hypothetical protein
LMPDFIELVADTDNIRLELVDAVDARDGTMLPIPAAKDDGATTLNPSSNLMVSWTQVSSLGKALRAPIM